MNTHPPEWAAVVERLETHGEPPEGLAGFTVR